MGATSAGAGVTGAWAAVIAAGAVCMAGAAVSAGWAGAACSPPIIMATPLPSSTTAPIGARIIQVFTDFLDLVVRA